MARADEFMLFTIGMLVGMIVLLMVFRRLGWWFDELKEGRERTYYCSFCKHRLSFLNNDYWYGVLCPICGIAARVSRKEAKKLDSVQDYLYEQIERREVEHEVQD